MEAVKSCSSLFIALPVIWMDDLQIQVRVGIVFLWSVTREVGDSRADVFVTARGEKTITVDNVLCVLY
jgi:hypothetical protein